MSFYFHVLSLSRHIQNTILLVQRKEYHEFQNKESHYHSRVGKSDYELPNKKTQEKYKWVKYYARTIMQNV